MLITAAFPRLSGPTLWPKKLDEFAEFLVTRNKLIRGLGKHFGGELFALQTEPYREEREKFFNGRLVDLISH